MSIDHNVFHTAFNRITALLLAVMMMMTVIGVYAEDAVASDTDIVAVGEGQLTENITDDDEDDKSNDEQLTITDGETNDGNHDENRMLNVEGNEDGIGNGVDEPNANTTDSEGNNDSDEVDPLVNTADGEEEQVINSGDGEDSDSSGEDPVVNSGNGEAEEDSSDDGEPIVVTVDGEDSDSNEKEPVADDDDGEEDEGNKEEEPVGNTDDDEGDANEEQPVADDDVGEEENSKSEESAMNNAEGENNEEPDKDSEPSEENTEDALLEEGRVMLRRGALASKAKSCNHRGTLEKTVQKTEYRVFDLDSHTVIKTYHESCSVCGYSRTYSVEEGLASHKYSKSFYDGERCTECLFDTGATGAEYDTVWNEDDPYFAEYYLPYASFAIAVIGADSNVHTFCISLEQFDGMGYIYQKRSERHDFDKNGRCKICKYQKGTKCNHQPVKGNKQLSKVAVPVDDEQHEYIIVYSAVCSICGETLEEGIEQKPRPKEDHKPNGDGICQICGYAEDLAEVNRESYYSLLNQLRKAKKNPLKDPVFKRMISNILAGALKREEDDSYLKEVEELLNALEKADTTYQMIYLYGIFGYEFGDLSNETGRTAYSGDENKVYISKGFRSGGDDEDNFLDTFFHESGHASQLNPSIKDRVYNAFYDTLMGSTDSKGRLKKEGSLTADVKKYLNQKLQKYGKKLNKKEKELILQTLLSYESDVDYSVYTEETADSAYGRLFYVIGTWMPPSLNSVEFDGNEYKYIPTESQQNIVDAYISVRDEMIEEFLAIPYSNSSMVSDIYNGVTNNKLGCGYGFGVVGHINYWVSDTIIDSDIWMNGKQMEEAWAEYFSARVLGDRKEIQRNKDYFPTTCNELDKLAKTLLDAYIDLYKDY